MSSDTEPAAQVVNGIHDERRAELIDEPTTPQDDDSVIASSQQSIPPTEAPNSPIEPSSSFETEANEDRAAPAVIPSSLTPPPSSQVPNAAAIGAANPLGLLGTQRSGMFSPPATGMNGVKRESVASEFAGPMPSMIADASIEELRTMLQACMAEQARLKMEAAHHKLQFNMLSIQAEEDTKRAEVEHEMTKKEVQALQQAECARQARRDLITASESAQAKYLQLKVLHERVLEENDTLHKKVKAARKVIQQKEDEIASLVDEREMLLNRIRENREHFHLLCSPGGMFHGVVTPKLQATSPQQHRSTPRQPPRSANRDSHRDHNGEGFAVLLQALSQDNNSAPSTPMISQRPAPRLPAKHTRNVQSMSSLPSTPQPRTNRADHHHHHHHNLYRSGGGLLPSIDLVPQTEPPRPRPPHHTTTRFMPETPTTPARGGSSVGRDRERRKSRESTISAEDNQELARQALQSFASRGSQPQSQSQHSIHNNSRTSLRGGNGRGAQPGQEEEGEEEQVFESQASQAASEMLRRDHSHSHSRESFEVAVAAASSRDGTPAAADRSAKLQAKLFGGLGKGGLSSSVPAEVVKGGAPAGLVSVSMQGKRKFSGQHGGEVGGGVEGEYGGVVRDPLTSPTKKLREVGGLRGDTGRLGLGIQYGRER